MTAATALMHEQGQGEARWWGGALAVIKATAADTDGEFTLVEVTDAPGTPATPPVIMTKYHFYVWTLEGEGIITIDGETKVHRAGDFASVPRGTPWSFGVGDSGWRGLIMTTPAGFEEVIRALGDPAESLTLPPPPGVWPSFDSSELFAEHGLVPAE
jgi:quercetin dioxygenase-like cupin family protein